MMTTDQDGLGGIDDDNNFKYNISYGELLKQFFIIVRFLFGSL